MSTRPSKSSDIISSLSVGVADNHTPSVHVNSIIYHKKAVEYTCLLHSAIHERCTREVVQCKAFTRGLLAH